HQQRHEADALDLTLRAERAGAGKGAQLLEVVLRIEQKDYDAAKAANDPYLERHPDDVNAVYDGALIADHQNDYNRAREGYYRVLKLDPRYADARYNLAQLTLRFGATDEAKLHATKFAQAFPNDPRKPYLLQLVGLGM